MLLLFYSWDNFDAEVVCRQLGFRGGDAYTGAHFGNGDESMPIWLDNVQCLGTESSLTLCRHNAWGDENCSHHEDASVSCGKCLILNK